MRYILWMLVFVPISLALSMTHMLPPTWVFVTSGLAIVPLAGLISQATEEMAKHLGDTIGGLRQNRSQIGTRTSRRR